MNILRFNEFVVNEALPSKRTIDQLKKVMKISRKTDIGRRISNMNDEGANIEYIRNPIEYGIESAEDYNSNPPYAVNGHK